MKSKLPVLSNGDLDYVAALYSNISDSPTTNGSLDPHNIIKCIDCSFYAHHPAPNVTEAIKLLVPEGFRDFMSLTAQDYAAIRIHEIDYLAKIRGMATKVPGWGFTAY